MIDDFLMFLTYITMLVFLIILSISSYRSVKSIKKNSVLLGELNDTLQEEMQVQEAHYEALHHDMIDSNQKLCDKIDELRLQIGIIRGSMTHTIHIPPSIPNQEKTPYKGAKRGPKPKIQAQE
jgi:hypothetical protein